MMITDDVLVDNHFFWSCSFLSLFFKVVFQYELSRTPDCVLCSAASDALASADCHVDKSMKTAEY
jgi:hypothetical protein